MSLSSKRRGVMEKQWGYSPRRLFFSLFVVGFCLIVIAIPSLHAQVLGNVHSSVTKPIQTKRQFDVRMDGEKVVYQEVPASLVPNSGRVWNGKNPFHAPFATTDYYGSGDVDKNGAVEVNDVELARAMALGKITATSRADVDGDGNVDLADVSLIDGATRGQVLPGQWNALSTRAQRLDWIRRVLSIEKTDEQPYSSINLWVCVQFGMQTFIHLAGFGGDLLPTEFDGGQTQFNIPCYVVDLYESGFGHFINAILVGDDPLRFEDWYFFEPQEDSQAVPGRWDMPYGVTARILAPQGILPHSCRGSQAICFIVDQSGMGMATETDPDLLRSRPAVPGTPISNDPYIWNPRVVDVDRGFLLFERYRDDLSRTSDLLLTDLSSPDWNTAEPLIRDEQYSKLLDVAVDPSGVCHILWKGKSHYTRSLFYGILDPARRTVTAVSHLCDTAISLYKASLLMRPNGANLAVWEVRGTASTQGIYWASPDGAAWSTPSKLTDFFLEVPDQWSFADLFGRDFDYTFGTCVDASGLVDLVWRNADNLYHARYSTSWSAPRPVGISGARTGICLSAATTGNTDLFCWDEDSHRLLQAQYNGSRWLPPLTIDSTTNPSCPSITKASSGMRSMAYQTQSGQQSTIVWRTYSGDSWGEARSVWIPPDVDACYPRLTAMRDGSSVIVWSARSVNRVQAGIYRFYPLVPAVTSINPESGPVGTSVVISGHNFAQPASRNIIRFGAVRASSVGSGTSTSLTAIAPGGATYAPITVTSDGLTACSDRPFVVTFPGGRGVTPSSFPARVDFTSGTSPRGAALGDFDGDGRVDAAVVNAGSNSISVFRNTSTGGSIDASAFAQRVDLSTGTNPWGVAVGDIDGDGKLDLAVTDAGGDSVSVFRNTSTSGGITTGSFASRVKFATGESPMGIAIRDLDGDGKPEIALVNYHSVTLSVFRNTSEIGSLTTSSFAGRIDFPAPQYTTPQSIAIGDLDGDGKPDIAVGNYNGNTLSVFRNSSDPWSIPRFAFTRSDFITGRNPFSVSIGDLDGDGAADVVVSDYQCDSISVYRNRSAIGSIQFDPRADFPAGTSPASAGIADIDGDGLPDIVVTNYNAGSMSILHNVSVSGSITSSSFSPRVDFATASHPGEIAVGDIDNDGKPDLLVPDGYGNSLSVFRNIIMSPPTIDSSWPMFGPVGMPVNITGKNFGTTPADNTVYFGAVKAAISNASSGSLTVTVPAGATYSPISVTTGGLTAYSGKPFVVSFPNPDRLDSSFFAAPVDIDTPTKPADVAIADLDADGKPDLIIANGDSNFISVMRNMSGSRPRSQISFAPRVDYAVGRGASAVRVADLDGDGWLDIVVCNTLQNSITVLQNKCTPGTIVPGSFTRALDVPVLRAPRSLAIGDIDQDGKPDIAVGNYDSNCVSLLRNVTVPSANPSVRFAPHVDLPLNTVARSLALSDLDNDGKPDLLALGWRLAVMRNSSACGSIGQGSFATEVDLPIAGSYGWSICVAAGDLDGDARADIAVSWDGISGSVRVWRNVGKTGSLDSSSFEAPVTFASNVSKKVVLADIDGDGKTDLIAASRPVSVFRNVGSGEGLSTHSFSSPVEIGHRSTGSCVAVGDLDADGKPELVVAYTDSMKITVFRSLIVPYPERTVLLAPADRSVLTADTVVCMWNAGAFQVDRYLFECDTDSSFSTALKDSVIGDTTKTLRDLVPNQIYYWRVRAHNVAGWGIFSFPRTMSITPASIVVESNIPTEFSLAQNHPNPFNGSTIISYGLPQHVFTRLEVFAILGQRVAILVDGPEEAGYHQVHLSGSNLASGVYFYRLEAGTYVQTKRFLLLK
jgi:hypothetical protein